MPGVDLCAYWYHLHLNFKHPFDIFPPIFGDFDVRQKRFTRLHLERHGELPASFGPFAGPYTFVDVASLKLWDQPTNIIVRGEPDIVCKDDKGRLTVLDFKTSRFSKGQDPLRPLYEAQVSLYAFLLEALGRGDAARAGLVYFEPVLDESDDDLLKTLTKKGLRQDWITTPFEFDIDRDNVRSLLSAVRKLYDLSLPPDCNRKGKNCRDCGRLKQIYDLYSLVERTKLAAAMGNQDALLLQRIDKHSGYGLREAFASLANAGAPPNNDFDLWSHWEWPSEAELN
jgi:hypothetical protein